MDTMNEREDDVERLARRTAEEMDRLARQRQEDYFRDMNKPIQINEWPLWFRLIPVVGIVIVVVILMLIARFG